MLLLTTVAGAKTVHVDHVDPGLPGKNFLIQSTCVPTTNSRVDTLAEPPPPAVTAAVTATVAKAVTAATVHLVMFWYDNFRITAVFGLLTSTTLAIMKVDP